MVKKKVLYKEGDWFSVPLNTGGYGLGIVARSNGKGIVLGYFFGPKRENSTVERNTLDLMPSDAIMIIQFGDLGLIRGEWQVISHSPTFSRDKWPLPSFARIDVISNKVRRIDYDEDTLYEEKEQVISFETAKSLPRDGLWGYRAVEQQLAKILTVNET